MNVSPCVSHGILTRISLYNRFEQFKLFMAKAELSTDNISHSISQSRYTTNYSHMQTPNNRMYRIKVKSIPLRKDLAFFDILLMTEKMILNIYNDKEIRLKIFAQSTSLCPIPSLSPKHLSAPVFALNSTSEHCNCASSSKCRSTDRTTLCSLRGINQWGPSGHMHVALHRPFLFIHAS